MSGRQARAAKRRKFRTVTQALRDYYVPLMRQIARERILVEKILAEMQEINQTTGQYDLPTDEPPHA